jgi:hypothetical protein
LQQPHVECENVSPSWPGAQNENIYCKLSAALTKRCTQLDTY